MGFLVGIPTLNRYDLLDKCIESIKENTKVPDKILVVDNGGSYSPKHDIVEIIKPRKNLGVAASWNMLQRLSNPLDIIISNDDVCFGKNALETMLEPSADIVMGGGFTVFKVRHEVWKKVGPYDENFYPAYFEDNDYAYRLILNGSTRKDVNIHSSHAGSATIAAFNGADRGHFNAQFNACRDYFIRKWGGIPGEEKFLTPFKHMENTTIGSDAKTVRGIRFSAACAMRSDINEHCLTLYELAKECSHITEFGTGAGNSTISLLHAQPKKLVCYALSKPSIITELEPIKEDTELNWIGKSTYEIEIEPTDMLFIDSKHTYNHLSIELYLHARKVSKYIVIHDTVIFGEKGEDGGKGIMAAVTDFLEMKKFKVKNEYKNNNGLMILEKSKH